MRSVTIIVLILTIFHSTQAWHAECGTEICVDGQFCMDRNGNETCVKSSMGSFIGISNIPENTWVENHQEYTLFRSYIINFGENIRHITIGTDTPLELKYNESSIWNINYNHKTLSEFATPPYQAGIKGGKSFGWGFIIKGKACPQMKIRYLVF
ncbi:hypothetical protein CYY_008006 [Polysphondylium violaceum]|uniref:Carbohydrate binding domain-containing protein n=1 Tax=Polysphondylium violaceum TaxID=133409 RepID=A0A8J4UXA8_9MYCE|nr:hypothetical protein CYY_008006 [Polysphondylium violaceum]